ncbi:MAG: hypothetical protein KF813_00945 [Trueperaceae bacterium]|nr:hypothetical protein [Trueperaceae bacterium]
MALHRRLLFALVALVALAILSGFAPAPQGQGSGPDAPLLAQLSEYETGCAIVTDAQITAAIGDGVDWFFVSAGTGDVDEQGRVVDEDDVYGYGSAYVCSFEPEDSLIRALTIMYIELGDWIFPGLLEYHIDELGEDDMVVLQSDVVTQHQFPLDPDQLFWETIGLCSNGAAIQFSYSAATGDPSLEALERLGTLFCTL